MSKRGANHAARRWTPSPEELKQEAIRIGREHAKEKGVSFVACFGNNSIAAMVARSAVIDVLRSKYTTTRKCDIDQAVGEALKP